MSCQYFNFHISGMIWFVPLTSCFISNMIIRSNYKEEHKEHNYNTIMLDENNNEDEDDNFGYKLTQPIKKDWFMSKECKLFGPFIAVNVGLFMVYFLLYYFIHIAWQGLRNPRTSVKLNEM